MVVGRIRVLIAGNIYVKRALVRRFLEDDGYEVVGEAMTSDELMAVADEERPDALVVDDELLPEGAVAALRRELPDAKVIVFTSSSPGEGWVPPGADGYLEKGVGLAALTAILGRLFSDGSVLEPALVGAEGVDGVGDGDEAMAETAPIATVATTRTSRASRNRSKNGALVRLTAFAGGALLVVWGMIAMITTGGADTQPTPADTTDQTDGGTVIAQPEQTALDAAYNSMDTMMAAIEGGNYVLATVQAQSFMDDRAQALTEGFSISGLDAEVTTRLETVVAQIPASAAADLRQILGALFPVLEDESEPGGGSDVVLGTSITDPGGTTGGDTTTGGNDDGGGGGGGNDGGEPTVGPGDGRAWGQSHKQDHEPGSGPPPWAKGKGKGNGKAA